MKSAFLVPFWSLDVSGGELKIRISTNLRWEEESTIVDVGSEASSGSQRIDLRMDTPAILYKKQ